MQNPTTSTKLNLQNKPSQSQGLIRNRSHNKIAWSEGTLLSPHHLHHADIYHEQNLNLRFHLSQPFAWGVADLKIDQEQLVNFQLGLEHFSGIFPDGLICHLGEQHEELPATRPIEESWFTENKTLGVFVCVRKSHLGPTPIFDSSDQRFSLAEQTLFDKTGQADSILCEVGLKNLKIIFSHENREDFESIQIAEIEKTHTGEIQLIEDFIPPCLQITGSHFLISETKKLFASLIQKRRTLSQSNKERDRGIVEFDRSDTTRFLWIHCISSFIAILKTFLDHPSTSPFSLYQETVRWLASLSVFHSGQELHHEPFQHQNLRKTFLSLFHEAHQMLEEVALDKHKALLLKSRPDGLHLTKIEEDSWAQSTRFFLRVETGSLSIKEAEQKLPRLCKIASWGQIKNLLSAASPGASIEICHRPPAEIPIREGSVYFEIETQNTTWANILKEKTMAVFLPPSFDPEQTTIELLGVGSNNS